MDNKELISNIAKYTSATIITPIVSVGVGVGGVALAVYYFLKNVPFKNWKTTTLTTVTAATIFFSSDLGKPVRDGSFTYFHDRLHNKVKQLETENDYLENKLADTTAYLHKEMKSKVDSVNLIKDIEIRVRTEMYANGFKNLQENQGELEKDINQLQKNQNSIVGNINYTSKKLDEISGTLNNMKAIQAMNKNKDLEKRINIVQEQKYVSTKKQTSAPTNFNQEISKSKNNATKTYWTTIDQGESLSKIAQEHYGSWEAYKQIAKENGINDANKIEIGQPIKLPSYGLKNKNGINDSSFPKNTLTINQGDNLVNRLMSAYSYNWNEAKERANEIVAYNKKIGNKYATMGTIKHNKIIVSIN